MVVAVRGVEEIISLSGIFFENSSINSVVDATGDLVGVDEVVATVVVVDVIAVVEFVCELLEDVDSVIKFESRVVDPTEIDVFGVAYADSGLSIFCEIPSELSEVSPLLRGF